MSATDDSRQCKGALVAANGGPNTSRAVLERQQFPGLAEVPADCADAAATATACASSKQQSENSSSSRSNSEQNGSNHQFTSSPQSQRTYIAPPAVFVHSLRLPQLAAPAAVVQQQQQQQQDEAQSSGPSEELSWVTDNMAPAAAVDGSSSDVSSGDGPGPTKNTSPLQLAPDTAAADVAAAVVAEVKKPALVVCGSDMNETHAAAKAQVSAAAAAAAMASQTPQVIPQRQLQKQQSLPVSSVATLQRSSSIAAETPQQQQQQQRPRPLQLQRPGQQHTGNKLTVRHKLFKKSGPGSQQQHFRRSGLLLPAGPANKSKSPQLVDGCEQRSPQLQQQQHGEVAGTTGSSAVQCASWAVHAPAGKPDMGEPSAPGSMGLSTQNSLKLILQQQLKRQQSGTIAAELGEGKPLPPAKTDLAAMAAAAAAAAAAQQRSDVIQLTAQQQQLSNVMAALMPAPVGYKRPSATPTVDNRLAKFLDMAAAGTTTTQPGEAWNPELVSALVQALARLQPQQQQQQTAGLAVLAQRNVAAAEPIVGTAAAAAAAATDAVTAGPWKIAAAAATPARQILADAPVGQLHEHMLFSQLLKLHKQQLLLTATGSTPAEATLVQLKRQKLLLLQQLQQHMHREVTHLEQQHQYNHSLMQPNTTILGGSVQRFVGQTSSTDASESLMTVTPPFPAITQQPAYGSLPQAVTAASGLLPIAQSISNASAAAVAAGGSSLARTESNGLVAALSALVRNRQAATGSLTGQKRAMPESSMNIGTLTATPSNMAALVSALTVLQHAAQSSNISSSNVQDKAAQAVWKGSALPPLPSLLNALAATLQARGVVPTGTKAFSTEANYNVSAAAAATAAPAANTTIAAAAAFNAFKASAVGSAAVEPAVQGPALKRQRSLGSTAASLGQLRPAGPPLPAAAAAVFGAPSIYADTVTLSEVASAVSVKQI